MRGTTKTILATALAVIGLLVLAFTLALNAHADTPKTVTLDKTRTVVIKDVITSPDAAGEIFKLTLKSSIQPIDIVLSSPGGSIHASLNIESAIRVAQSRGVLVRCHVPIMAASMAFYLLTQCDERYVLKNTFLLFHPARVNSRQGFTQDELDLNLSMLKVLEKQLKENMQRVMKMDSDLFEKHYKAETLWLASNLGKVTDSDFLQVVDDIINVPADAMFSYEDENPLKKLFGGEYL